MVKSIVILLALLACGFSNAQNYCDIKSCGEKNHTMCIYKSSEPGPQCTDVIGVGLTEDEKQRVLKVHNELRQKVAKGEESRGKPGPQPAAKNMPNLEWDTELETLAQRWANQCEARTDDCRNVDRFAVGQSMTFIGTTGNVITDIKVESLVMAWYNEVGSFNKDHVTSFKDASPNTRRYSQIVWAKTTKLGCGAMRYKDGKYNKFFIICNYGPAGNIQTESVYEVA